MQAHILEQDLEANRREWGVDLTPHLCRSPNVARVIKSRRIRCAGHVTKMEELRGAFNILTVKPIGRDV